MGPRWASPFNELDEDNGVLVLRRTATPFRSVEEIEAEAARLRIQLPVARRAHRVILRDLRLVRGNNTPAIDEARNRCNRELFGGWGKMVVLVQTEVGQLHAIRAIQNMGVSGDCYCDPARAMAAARATLLELTPIRRSTRPPGAR